MMVYLLTSDYLLYKSSVVSEEKLAEKGKEAKEVTEHDTAENTFEPYDSRKALHLGKTLLNITKVRLKIKIKKPRQKKKLLKLRNCRPPPPQFSSAFFG